MLILLGDWVCLLTRYWCSEFLVEVIVTSRNNTKELRCALGLGKTKQGAAVFAESIYPPSSLLTELKCPPWLVWCANIFPNQPLSPSSASARICYYLTPPSSIFRKTCLFSLSSWYQISSNLQLVKIQMDGWPFLLNWLPLMSHLLYFPKEKC